MERVFIDGWAGGMVVLTAFAICGLIGWLLYRSEQRRAQ